MLRSALAVAVIALVVSAFQAGTYGARLFGGVSRAAETPQYLVRLEIINATGTSGVAGKAAEEFSKWDGLELKVQVVDILATDVKPMPESFVVSREENLESARELAFRLGFDPEKVKYVPLTDNSHQVSATLVLGLDYEQIIINPQS